MRSSLTRHCAKAVAGVCAALRRHGGDWSKLSNEHEIEVFTEVLRDLRKEQQQQQSLKPAVELFASHSTIDKQQQANNKVPPSSSSAADGGYVKPTKEMFLHFLDQSMQRVPCPNDSPRAPIAVIPAAEGTGGTTTLRQTEQWLKERFPTATFLFVPGNICKSVVTTAVVADTAGNENLNEIEENNAEHKDLAHTAGIGPSSSLRFRVLNAVIGAPPGACEQTAKMIQQRLGILDQEKWAFFHRYHPGLGQIFNDAVRAALNIQPDDHLLLAVDDDRRRHQPPHTNANSPLCLPSVKAGDTILSLNDLAPEYRPHPLHPHTLRRKGKGRVLTVGVTEPEFIPHDFGSNNFRTPLYRLPLPPPNPVPFIEAARLRLGLAEGTSDNAATRMDEVRYMLRHAAVHARFLADVFEAICEEQGPPLTVADFDARFEAFVGERIACYIRHCNEHKLLPSHLFHFLVNRYYEGKFTEASAVAANALGLCEIHWAVGKISGDDRNTDWIGPQCIYIHPKVFVMLHDAVQVHQSQQLQQPISTTASLEEATHSGERLPPNVTGPPSPRPLALMLALARRINAFIAMSPTDLIPPPPQQSASDDAVQCLGDITVLLLMTCLAHDDDNFNRARRYHHGKGCLPERILLSTLFPLWDRTFPIDTQKTSYDDKFQRMKFWGSPRDAYILQRTSVFPKTSSPVDATFGGLLTDPVMAPRSLRLMHQRGIISGALHKLNICDPHLQMTIGIVAIAESTPDGTAAAITELRRKRAAWAVEAATNPTTPAAYPWAASRAPPPSATAKLLQTTLFLHVLVVAVAPPEYVPQPFAVGTAQCFETMVTLDHLRSVCPMVGSVCDGL